MQLLAFGVPRPVLRSPCWAGVEHAAIGRCCTGASNVTTARATSPVSEGCWASGRSREACCVYEEPCAGVGAGSAEMWEDIKTLDQLTRRKYLHDYADEVALVAGAFLPVGMLEDPEELDKFWDAVDDCVFGLLTAMVTTKE